MQELAWIAETLRVWLEGGTFADIKATEGFRLLVLAAACLVPSTLVMLGIGMTQWHETPLGQWLGSARPVEDDWVSRARDLDKDGTTDF